MKNRKQLSFDIDRFFENITKLQQKNYQSAIWEKLKIFKLFGEKREQIKEEINEYNNLLTLTNNEEEVSIIERELEKIYLEEDEIIEKVIEIIIGENDPKDNCLIEIRPGTGGVEAGLFGRDIYEMYYKFIEKKKWKIEIIESRADTIGNLSFISFFVKGKESFELLKNESGVHRVQRVPITENKGRIQTSTASVVVLPEVNEITVKIENKDIRIDTYRSGGAGGQHVNTTDSAIRITHLPTGITATSQDGRSQHDNKEKALMILRSRLFEKYKNEQEGAIGNIRNSAIGSGERAEKIRTYNYPQNRVTDHRIGLTLNKLNLIIEGDLDELCERLKEFKREARIASFIKEVEFKANE